MISSFCDCWYFRLYLRNMRFNLMGVADKMYADEKLAQVNAMTDLVEKRLQAVRNQVDKVLARSLQKADFTLIAIH
jgi:hypothetical protein